MPFRTHSVAIPRAHLAVPLVQSIAAHRRQSRAVFSCPVTTLLQRKLEWQREGGKQAGFCGGVDASFQLIILTLPLIAFAFAAPGAGATLRVAEFGAALVEESWREEEETKKGPTKTTKKKPA